MARPKKFLENRTTTTINFSSRLLDLYRSKPYPEGFLSDICNKALAKALGEPAPAIIERKVHSPGAILAPLLPCGYAEALEKLIEGMNWSKKRADDYIQAKRRAGKLIVRDGMIHTHPPKTKK